MTRKRVLAASSAVGLCVLGCVLLNLTDIWSLVTYMAVRRKPWYPTRRVHDDIQLSFPMSFGTGIWISAEDSRLRTGRAVYVCVCVCVSLLLQFLLPLD